MHYISNKKQLHDLVQLANESEVVRDYLGVPKDFKNIVKITANSVHQQIGDNSTAATIFYLKNKSKKRGYIERQEITGADGMPTNFQIEIIDP